MRKTSPMACAIALGLASLTAGAAGPKAPPTNAYTGTLAPTCTCDWDAGECTATWNDLGYLGVLNLVYGADLEFEAEWIQQVTAEDGTVTEVKQKASVESDLDDYACDGTQCSATAAVVLPEYPDDAEVSFLAKVKAFENRSTGAKPRNFVKDAVDCPLPE